MSDYEFGVMSRVIWNKTGGEEEVAAEAPHIRDLVGVLGNGWTGGLSSVEYVRQQREGK